MRHKIFPHCFTHWHAPLPALCASTLKVRGAHLLLTCISVLLLFTGVSVSAIGRQRPRALSGSATLSFAQRERKRVVTLRHNDTTEGSRCLITSDTPLDDYSSYVEGERFIVRVPQANLSGTHNNPGGRGFADLRAEQSGDDVLVSFRLQAGATVHLNQTFNRLAIEFLTNERAVRSDHAK